MPFTQEWRPSTSKNNFKKKQAYRKFGRLLLEYLKLPYYIVNMSKLLNGLFGKEEKEKAETFELSQMIEKIQRYIDSHLVCEAESNGWTSKKFSHMGTLLGVSAIASFIKKESSYQQENEIPTEEIKLTFNDDEEDFGDMLITLINKKQYTESEVYKRADIDRRLFSKIRSTKGYRPKKITVFALILALHCNLDEALDLMSRASYTFSPSNKQDLTIRFCIENKIYELWRVNLCLEKLNLPLIKSIS